MRKTTLVVCILAAAALPSACSEKKPAVAVVEKSATDLAADIAAGRTTSEAVTAASVARIAELNPQLHAVILVNPKAAEDARAADARRAAGQARGPLDGMPVLVKDNIDTAGMATTAGSLALAENVPVKDAPVVRKLREAGAIILGKANLSEWANMRGGPSTAGWSGMGGLTRNPHALDRTASGSSSGPASAVAASLAPAAIGTETDGSIVSPASMNGIVALKPTVGLVSRTGIIPISHTQDTAGPMTRTVADAALLLTAIAGSDPADAATVDADSHATDYTKALKADALKGVRLGALRFMKDFLPGTRTAFEAALAAMRDQGAEIVDIDGYDFNGLGGKRIRVMMTEFKVDLDAYLAGTPPAVKVRSLADLIVFNSNEPREMAWFGQPLLQSSENTKGLSDPGYIESRDQGVRMAGVDGIDRMIRENNVIALVVPTSDPAPVVDVVYGTRNTASSTSLAAVPGYPNLTVPMGLVSGLPVGLSFIGPKWSEATLLGLGYAYEQATHMRTAPQYRANTQTPLGG